ncbi:hypothetical protein D3C81_2288360 [compost metagenome]
MVDTGPSIPTWAASDEPIRLTASMIASTGSTVHTVALTSDSQYTGGGAWPSAVSGCNTAKCSTHNTQATQLA